MPISRKTKQRREENIFDRISDRRRKASSKVNKVDERQKGLKPQPMDFLEKVTKKRKLQKRSNCQIHRVM